MIGGLVARHAILVKRAPLVDDGRGNEASDWGSATTHEVKGWAVDVGDTTEDTAHRDGSSVSYTLRGPLNADVRGSDRVVLFGDEFEVFGDVLRQPGATQASSHSIVRLTQWKG